MNFSMLIVFCFPPKNFWWWISAVVRAQELDFPPYTSFSVFDEWNLRWFKVVTSCCLPESWSWVIACKERRPNKMKILTKNVRWKMKSVIGSWKLENSHFPHSLMRPWDCRSVVQSNFLFIHSNFVCDQEFLIPYEELHVVF